MYGEHIEETGNPKHFEYAVLVAHKLQGTFVGSDVLQTSDQDAQPSRVEKLNLRQVDDEVVAAFAPGDPDWRVDVLAVEDAIRAACRRWVAKEVTADPWRWTRSLQVLAREGLPVTEFPQSSARMSPSTLGLAEAVLNGQVTHSGDKRLAEHLANARVTEDVRGTRIRKQTRDSTRHIDLAVCAVMAWSRATHHASRRTRARVVAW